MSSRGTKRIKSVITRFDPETGTAYFELRGEEVAVERKDVQLGRSRERSCLREGCEVSCLVQRTNSKLCAKDVWIVHSPDERARRR